MIPVCKGKTVRARDQTLIEQAEIPGRVLMELAGHRAAALIHSAHPHARVAILCGAGNNGGDGFVVARWLELWGHEVRTWAPRSAQTPDAGANRDLLTGSASAPRELADALEGATVLVDALLGTGQHSAPRGFVLAGVQALLQARRDGAFIFSLDLPTGVCADTGRALGGEQQTVHAHHTITFGYWKPGLLCAPGARLAGTVTVVDIGLDLARRYDPQHRKPDAWLLTAADVVPLLPTPPSHGAKWDRGHVAVRAGGGAAVLACLGAQAAGAGLVTLLAPRSEWPELHGLDPSVILAEPESFDPKRHDALLIGPGLGTHHVDPVRQAWSSAPVPVVADADALTILASHPTHRHPKAARLLTPHAAEAARLLGCGRDTVEADRLRAAEQLSSLGTVVLKGPHTIIHDTPPRIFPFADGRLATAGSGDVLAGSIAAGLARRQSPVDAATLAVWLHGAAAAHLPTHGTALHLIGAIRAATTSLRATV